MTKKLAVFGNPIAQSKSPQIHTMFAKELGFDIEYVAIQGDLNKVEQDFESFFSDSNAVGANVTMPFKDNACAWVSQLSRNAQAANSVNTIIKTSDGYIGDSTDGVGIVSDLKRLNMPIKGKHILLIGAGGAARGAIANILDESPAQIDILNRSLDKAKALASVVDNQNTYCIDDKSQLVQYDLIINATSLSLSGKLPDIDTSVVKSNTCVYDMVYQNQDTEFVKWAKRSGANKAADGLGMLVGQAAESFYLWFDKRPSVEPVLLTLRDQMNA